MDSGGFFSNIPLKSLPVRSLLSLGHHLALHSFICFHNTKVYIIYIMRRCVLVGLVNAERICTIPFFQDLRIKKAEGRKSL